MNATAGGGGVDLVQEKVNAPEFRQVRAARRRNTLLLYGCYNCPEEVSQGYCWLQECGLTKSLRLLVLRLELGSAFLTVSSCVVFFVSALGLCCAILCLLFCHRSVRCFCAAGCFKYSPATTCPERKEGARVPRRYKWKGHHHFFWAK